MIPQQEDRLNYINFYPSIQLEITSPCEVVDLLDIEASCMTATQGHGDEDTVIDRWSWPGS